MQISMKKKYQYEANRDRLADRPFVEEGFRDSYREDRGKTAEQTYDVIRFEEYGQECSPTLDNVRGELLIYYLSDSPTIEKETLFLWCRQLGKQLDAYHRCRSGQYCRYLNPYSIVVTDSGLVLLDLESEENAPVMKMMQQRAVRRHFVNQAVQAGAGGAQDAELYGYGRTIQFLLASAQITPALTSREERRLENVIASCTGTSKKPYHGIREAVKDLPVWQPHSEALRDNSRLRTGIILCAAAAVGLLLVGGIALTLIGKVRQANARRLEDQIAAMQQVKQFSEELEEAERANASREEADDGAAGEAKQEEDRAEADRADAAEEELSAPYSEPYDEAGESGMPDVETAVTRATEALAYCLEEKTPEANAQSITAAHRMEVAAVRALAESYVREDKVEEAADAYGRLMVIEDDPAAVEDATLRKMNLESGLGRLDMAVQTGERALAKLGESVLVQALTDEYRAMLEEGQTEGNE